LSAQAWVLQPKPNRIARNGEAQHS